MTDFREQDDIICPSMLVDFNFLSTVISVWVLDKWQMRTPLSFILAPEMRVWRRIFKNMQLLLNFC